MKLSSTFLSIAFIAFVLISLVIAKRSVSDEEKLVESVGKCVIANGIATIFTGSNFYWSTPFCVIMDFAFYEEGRSFVWETMKETIWSTATELIMKQFGVNFGAGREIVKK